MIPRGLILVLALAIGLALPLSGVALGHNGKEAPQAVLARDEDAAYLVTADDDGDDDDDDSNDGHTDRSGKSNDRTNSRFTGVSRDRDLSRGDLTRDWTRDGKGGKKRDWSRHHTNDRSRNDTR
jgi:hypothetical protein